jgi:hypothetical protein
MDDLRWRGLEARTRRPGVVSAEKWQAAQDERKTTANPAERDSLGSDWALEGGRSANRVVGGELNTAKVRLERGDAAGDSARLAGWRPQAHLGPQRSGKGPAAFMAGTARIRPKTIAAGRSRRNGFVSGRCPVVVAGRSTLGPGMQRHPRAMFVLLWS